MVTRIIHDFRRYIGWCAALFPYDFSMIIYDAANAKVAQFNPSRCINHNVIELNISVQDRPAMTVTNAINNLSKYCLGFILADRPALLHKRKQISAGCILHNDKYVCFCLKHLIQPYYILMPHDTQKTNFCFDLLVLKVSKLCFVDDLQSNFLKKLRFVKLLKNRSLPILLVFCLFEEILFDVFSQHLLIFLHYLFFSIVETQYRCKR